MNERHNPQPRPRRPGKAVAIVLLAGTVTSGAIVATLDDKAARAITGAADAATVFAAGSLLMNSTN